MLRSRDGLAELGADRMPLVALPCDAEPPGPVPRVISLVGVDDADTADLLPPLLQERPRLRWADAVAQFASCVAEVAP